MKPLLQLALALLVDLTVAPAAHAQERAIKHCELARTKLTGPGRLKC
jgi:hypothetical protein